MVGETSQSRFGNAYYHASIACVATSCLAKFQPSMLVVLPAIECKRQDVHKSLLNSRKIQTDYYLNCASLFVFTILV